MSTHDRPDEIQYKATENWSGDDAELHDTWGQSMPPDEDGGIRREKASTDWGPVLTPQSAEEDWGDTDTSPPTTTPQRVRETNEAETRGRRCSGSRRCASSRHLIVDDAGSHEMAAVGEAS